MNDIKILVNQLEQKVEKVIEMVNHLTSKDNKAANQLEAIAAKIINDIQKEIQECPCNKEILEAINGQTLAVLTKEDTKPFTGKYSYPNYNVGNEELGSSKNPNAMNWPEDFYKKP